VFGAVYDPSRQELFTAEKGKGAYLNGSRISVSKEVSDPCFIFNPSTGHGRFPKELSIKLMTKLLDMGKMIGQVKNFGSYGLHYAYIASGRAEAAISLMKDTFPEFAGKILVEEAGGVFSALDGGEFNYKTSAVLACNKNIFPELFKKLTQYF
jgi:myo-inositol-1(or 4)-monophosphatase